MIKPEFFDDPDVAELTPLARLFFIGLWIQADREGRLVDDMRRLKARLFPYDDVDLELLAVELHGKDMIRRYRDAENHGKFIWVRNFTKHQRPHPKEPQSLIPECHNGAGKRNGEPCKNTGRTSESGVLILDPLESNGTRNLESKYHSRTAEKPPSEVSLAMTHYHDGYLARFGEKPNINGAKDGSLLKKLLRQHGLSAVKARIENMLHSHDPFIQKSGCTIGILSSQWNKLRTRDNATGKTAGNLAAAERFANRKR